MVNFKKRLAEKSPEKTIDPVSLYDTLDRASDKGPLRPVQETILQTWHESRRSHRDIILKLHTGQGKTLIGLLILQSKLNETGEPAVYLCPNNFLIRQTVEQAKQFGIPVCVSNGELPFEFLSGKKMLITSVQKLFNGMTKFGLGPNSIAIHTVLMDDAHACIDAIRDAFLIRIEKSNQAYADMLSLFSDDLERQGIGTFADIRNHVAEAILPVPYWSWDDKNSEVAKILSKNATDRAVKFAWPVIRDMLPHCHCVFSGRALEIAPYLPPLAKFGSYFNAKHRIFMSATITDDAFLVKGLRLSPETIKKPLRFNAEKWSGEKMILIPSLIDESLDRSTMVERYAKPNLKAMTGTVALVPSVKCSADWNAYKSIIADRDSIAGNVADLKAGKVAKTLVIVNRYDGIDLPDEACRQLIVDSKPYSENLFDLYGESCRSTSNVSSIRVARTIEQGLGRSVRGEKDFCVIVLIGSDLVRAIRTKELRSHLSNQTAAQIELALEIVEMSREEINEGNDASEVYHQMVRQCLDRDDGWKQFYQERMNAVDFTPRESTVLEHFSAELEAEDLYVSGQVDEAVARIQRLLDSHVEDAFDRGWYMQTMARYISTVSKTQSNKMQVNAHKKNTYVLKPQAGMIVQKLGEISQKRMKNIADWISQFDSYEELAVTVAAMLDRFSFGVDSDVFERTTSEVASALGFENQRPEKEWGEGPDNLWCFRDGEFLLIECKNEAHIDRSEIAKRESEQMNRSTAWFKKYYPACSVKNFMIIPTNVLSSAGSFLDPVEVVNDNCLRNLKRNIRAFFDEFRCLDLRDLSEARIQVLVNAHDLSIDDLRSKYSKKVVVKRRANPS
ncbi:DEAD/DEAH box helicase family protein [Novipirellula sp.]|uniref:DEAD/DEAH box helicase family protein n=1 Tax=Novipirellula sp. TaxID=2795430 RepID=UPI0035650D9E